MIDLPAPLQKILPPPGLPRKMSFQNALWGLGIGTFLTGSVVFFTRYVGLTPVQIGIGLSLGGLLAVLGSMPFGHLADRIGGQRAWATGALVQAAAFATYPLARTFWLFLLVICVQTTADTLATAGRVVYMAAALPAESRVRAMAFSRAYLNAGWTVGAGLGAAALALDSRAGLLVLVYTAAAGIGLNGVAVLRMPPATPAGPTTGDAGHPSPWTVLRDRPYAAMSLLFGVLWLHSLVWAEVLPLWAITFTDVPKPVLGGLVALNTVLAVTLQVRATRGADTLPGVIRLARWAAWAAAVGSPLAALTGRTHGWLTIALLTLIVALFTGAELWVSAAQWFVQTEIPPAAQRGVYIGLDKSVQGLGRMLGPAGLTYLAIQTGGWGWWVIAGLFAGCGIGVRPVLAWVTATARDPAPVASP
ncbi:MFS transporter [Actinoplanes oblitus]|uniref:MFS transporter n=1 Tax=Actinoplanes oblitus TaxID=3040509 RepID=A0ABY8WB33_9ACTN|nr:MFS transporter [Actinoplanes oblitus]WIM94577.1 MFS transporter [Actinoplanes oblitus]